MRASDQLRGLWAGSQSTLVDGTCAIIICHRCACARNVRQTQRGHVAFNVSRLSTFVIASGAQRISCPMDANTEEPSTPSAFDLPTGSLSEKVAFPERPLHVLLVTTGSVASIKAPLIVDALLDVRLLTYPGIE